MNHLLEPKEVIEYLKQFAWVKDFDTVIERILESKTDDEENEDASI